MCPRTSFSPWYVASTLILILFAAVIPAPRAWAIPAIITGDNNRESNLCQSATGAAWLAAWATAKYTAPVTPTLTAIKLGADTSAYAANIAMKHCAPSITAPDTVRKYPDAGSCLATFHQPLTQEKYENWKGVPKTTLFDGARQAVGRDRWGELGRPFIYHFNTEADVRLLDPAKQEGASDDAWQPDAAGNITLPVGRNVVTWRADSMMSMLDLVPTFLIPYVVPGDKIAQKSVMKFPRISETIYTTYGRLTRWGDGGLPRRVISRFLTKKALEKLEGLPQIIVEKILAKKINSDWRTGQIIGTEVANSIGQEVWVYDIVPPTLVTNTDPATFPASLQPLLNYDPATATYYLEAFAPRIADATVASYAKLMLSAEDECQGQRPSLDPERVDTPVRGYWFPGDQGTLQWWVADSGPNVLGLPNYSFVVDQRFEVRDSNPPILIAPPSKVVEITATDSSIAVDLGSPRIFDLADLTPAISNDAPADSSFNLGINTVTWSATDTAGNTANQEQLINVKLEGVNTAPLGHNQTVSAVTYTPLDIILTGFDNDFDPASGRYDPLTFMILGKPQNGSFVAPLRPYFIDDYRLEASALRFAGQPAQVDPGRYCDDLQQGAVSGPSQFQMKYPYTAEWFNVDDDGTTVVYDQGDISCQFGDMEKRYRLAAIDVDGALLHHRVVSSTMTDIYIDWRTKAVYAIDFQDPGSPNKVSYYDKQLNSLGVFNAEYLDRFGSPARVTGSAFITSDTRGIVYVGGRGNGANAVVTYQGPTVAAEIGSASYRFLGRLHEDSNMRDIATDSDNNVYISKPDRILKFAASTLDGEGNLLPGALVGWMGRCDNNLTNTYACDTVNHRSTGFSCTDTLCGTDTANNYGSDPAQFNDARGIAVDPNDILYVSDYGNSRVQRFTPQGDFAGQAKSTGAGYGFILGDFGRPEEITVNSDHFYILNRNLLHVLQTTPVTPIDDSSAKVTYRSHDNFVGTDTFTFAVTDGLAGDTGSVIINIERNYRPPVISVPPSYTIAEDGTVEITLVGTDPDGYWDVLSFEIVEPPQHGTLSGVGANIVYTPDDDYYGEDSFSYRVSDGVYESEPAVVHLAITSVEDPPRLTTETAVSEGLGFTFQFPVEVFDPDADESLMVTIDWGDGSAIETNGVVMRNGEAVTGDLIQPDGTLPDDLEATGPLLDLSPDGTGSVVFEHAYAEEGAHIAQICVSDRVETLIDGTQQVTVASQSTCTQTTFSVSLVTELLLLVVPDADQVDPGAAPVFTVTVTSRPFDIEVPGNPPGLDAVNLLISGATGTGLVLTRLTPARGVCNFDRIQGSYSCALGNLAFGDEISIEIEGRVSPLAPGHAMLSMVTNRHADAVEPLEEEAVGIVVINASGNPPTALTLSRSIGAVSGGDAVTLTGQDFDAGAVVLFDDIPALSVDVLNANTITLITPQHIEGTVDVAVVNSDDASSTLPQAFYYSNLPPAGGGNTNGNTDGNSGGGSLDIYSLIMALLLLTLLRGPLSAKQPKR